MDEDELEAAAQRLEASGLYRVLRRLKSRQPPAEPSSAPTRLGLFVDVETTGLDPKTDEIIELAMVPFTYTLEGEIHEVLPAFEGLRDPGRPIPAAVTAITGITDEMVAGRSIDQAAVSTLAAPAVLVVAHNAAFDRRFLERFCETFSTKPWACSMSQVDWSSEGYEGAKLAYLAAHAGFFYERHRASHDCLAALELLARVQRSGRTGLAQLLHRARTPSWRIWAENAPFDLKDVLKARGYRWNGEGESGPRAWYIDVDGAAREAEIRFLQTEIYRGEVVPLIKRLDAYDRFSDRV